MSIRAAVPSFAVDRFRALDLEDAEIVAFTPELDLGTIDFLVASNGDRDHLGALAEAERVKVVQVLSAGTDWIEADVPPDATLCSARGARDEPVAEWIVGALLGATTQLLACAPLRTWTERSLTELGDWTVLIVGMGSIGRRVAALLEPFGSEVIGVASRARDDVHGIDELPELLPRADALVVLTPLTDATRGLIGAPELARLPDGALVVNAGRGPVVDTDALVHETAGRLRAVLDVTDPEPLPDGHPLWTSPGVLSITPHMAGNSRRGHERAADLAARQFARFCAGEPLDNVVR